MGNAVKFTQRGTITIDVRDCDADAEAAQSTVAQDMKVLVMCRVLFSFRFVSFRFVSFPFLSFPFVSFLFVVFFIFTQERQREMCFCSTHCSVCCLDYQGMILISVSDTGLGIKAEKIKDIFNEFHRGEDDTVRSITGTGLGLSLCKQLVQAHGGQIYVESKVGEGSVFSFTVPKNVDSGSMDSPAVGSDGSDGTGGKTTGTYSDSDAGTQLHGAARLAERDAEIRVLRVKLVEAEDATQVLQERLAHAKIEVDQHKQDSANKKAAEAKAEPPQVTQKSENGHSNPTDAGLVVDSTKLDHGEAETVGVKSHSDLYGTIEVLSVDDHPVNQVILGY